MSSSSLTGIRIRAVLGPVLCAWVLAPTLCQGSVLSKHNTIAELQSLPVNSAVHLTGVVTWLDAADGLFWIQDETGAIPIAVNPLPAGLHAGEAVVVEGAKTTRRETPGGPASVGLAKIRVYPVEKFVPGPVRRDLRPPGDQGDGLHAAVWVVNLPGQAAVPEAAQDQLFPLIQDYPSGLAAQLRRPADLAMVGRAPVWMPLATPAALTFLLLLTFGALSWVFILRRRVRRQREALEKATETEVAIRELSSAMAQVSAGRSFDTPVTVQGGRDIEDLVVGVNTMLSELQRRERAKRDAEARLQHMALIDDLTGLPNRRLLADRLSQSLAKARRENHKVALLYVDLDGFKLVNDRLGHGVGDMLLGQVAQRMKSRFRQSDTLARIAGDEFALVMDHVQTWGDADTAAQSVMEMLEPAFEIDDHSIRITASVGISIFPDHALEGGQLLQQADCAMFAAKRNGKNRAVHFGDGLGSAARERLTLEVELRRAIENNEIEVHYQPEFDLATNTIVRFEALARWTHPKMGRIPPVSFIPIAEESGLIVPLGAYVMERACADATTWQRRAGRPIQVAVNVSSVQFARDSFLEEVDEVLRRTGLRPSLLQLELTESATLTGVERAADMMRRLTGRGIGIAMDDFGTGYSCLSYLPKLAFDALKLDRSFVNELAIRPETRAFVQSILSMAHNLHMKVIVEGIETREQLELMRALGTNEAQGYLLGRPTPNPMEQLGWGADIATKAREMETVR
jgi:diguanylate cyclase (GGDEF)-like protein